MDFPFEITVTPLAIPNCVESTIWINGPLLTFVGPNGSGKTQLLRAINRSFRSHEVLIGKKVRFLASGRLGPLENFRTDYLGNTNGRPNYKSGNLGPKSHSQFRYTSESIQGDFFTLNDRPDVEIKVCEILRKLFHRNVLIEWDAGNLIVKFIHSASDAKPYPASMEASGLLHLVSILAALYDDEIGALLIDEPEVSLHPQLQAFILQEIKNVLGNPNLPGKKLVFIATHSSSMLEIFRPEDLCSFVFCKKITEAPVQIAPGTSELKNKKIRELVARMGQEHKTAFFSSKPLLVEGISDAILAKSLDHKCQIYLEAAGAQIVPVVGKGEMPVVTKFMRLIGKDPVVLADADAFADSIAFIQEFHGRSEAIAAAQTLGHPDLAEFSRRVYSDFCEIVNSNWEDISRIAERHSYWKPDINGDECSTAKKRCAFCVLMNATDASIEKWSNSEKWKGIKVRTRTLLDTLSKAGCYILEKGAIEDYYLSSEAKSEGAKPTAAVAESEYIRNLDQVDVEKNYHDVIKALKFAGRKVEIDEAGELKNYLVSACAPIQLNMKSDILEDPNSVARRFIGDKCKLFDMKIVEDCREESCQLHVNLKSNVIGVAGFPLVIEKDSNIADVVDKEIRPNSNA